MLSPWANLLLLICIFLAETSGEITGHANQYAIEGSTLIFTCSSDEITQTIKWTVFRGNGQILEHRLSAEIETQKNDSIVQSTVKMEAVNSSDNSLSVECSTDSEGHQFKIYVIPKSLVPVITSGNTTIISTKVGDEVTLDCAVSIANNPVITWTRDGCILQQLQGVFSSRFVFPEITARDGGVYTCTVTEEAFELASDVTQDTKVFHVLVEMGVDIDIEESVQLFIPQGENAILGCNIAGYPINMTWTRNDDETLAVIDNIYSSKSHGGGLGKCELRVGPMYSVRDQAKTLVIHNITVTDEGTYRCTGEKDGEKLQQTFILKLSGVLSVPCQGLLIFSALFVVVQNLLV